MAKKTFFTISIFSVLFFASAVFAQPELGSRQNFNIQSNYDISNRDDLQAILIKNSLSAYWYVDAEFWEGLTEAEKQRTGDNMEILISEFETNIFPIITDTFGQVRSPGIDNDTRITLLFHPMKEGVGGYTNTADGYLKIQLPESNEREMVYINAGYLNSEIMKSFLAHELVHLITFNQKEISRGTSEDIWLNEARAEYAPTLLGYDDNYEGSNLQNRVKEFLSRPSDSLTEWRESPTDYGVANLFIQYLVDHYGIGILVDSLQSNKTGIASLNSALAIRGFNKNFEQIFKDWIITVLVNDCRIGENYCYFNENLKNLRITPLMNYLPLIGDSTLSVTNSTKDWSGIWHKFIGGKGTLKIDFAWVGTIGANSISYIVQYADGNIIVNELKDINTQGGKISIPQFGSQVISLTIMPVSKIKTSGFGNIEASRMFSWSASTIEQNTESPQQEIEIPSIVSLSKPVLEMTETEKTSIIDQLDSFINSLNNGCALTQDLYLGMADNSQVQCLQQFLKSLGGDIYPEGFVTGNFYTLTEQAVKRFQERYANEILTPWGLTKGSGYVGSTTRAKINILNNSTGLSGAIIPNILSLSKPLSQMSNTELNSLISDLEKFITDLKSSSTSCALTQDLYLGMADNSQVQCLQQFLKSLGGDIYPEGFVTGNFYTLTEQAVKRFQERYASEILTPWGLTKGTGYVGSTTRAKINELAGI
jgi:peptidoglycan hydrolase-like protein with peptidoglycan-binding domain